MGSPYDLFAPLYDRHWRQFSVEAFPVLDRLVLRHLPPGAHILDLCCGTGQIAAELVDRGFRVTGVDSAAGMLSAARRNAPLAQFVLADARCFSLEEPADAAIAITDSLNHLTSVDDLTAACARVRAALRDGGLFVFDLNTETTYAQRWIGSFGIVDDDQACIVGAAYDEATRLARFDATLFFREEGGRGEGWRREDIVVRERCHTEAEIRDALGTTGFSDVAIYDWRRDLDPAAEPGKLWVVGRAAGRAVTSNHPASTALPETGRSGMTDRR